MIDWQKVIMKENDTMQSAIEVLNSQALGIVIVVDTNGHILGTITDGDVRRALLVPNRQGRARARAASAAALPSVCGGDRDLGAAAGRS